VRSFAVGAAFTRPPDAADDDLAAGAAVAAPAGDSAGSSLEARRGGGGGGGGLPLPQGPAVIDLTLSSGLGGALACFHRASEGADACVVDGCGAVLSEQPGAVATAGPGAACGAAGCGTAAVARALGLPLLLVVDVAALRSAVSVAALLRSHSGSGPDVAGLVLNRAGGPEQVQEMRRGLAEAGVAAPVVAVLPQLEPDAGGAGAGPAAWCGTPCAAAAAAASRARGAAARAPRPCDPDALLELGRRAAVPPAPAPLPPPARAFKVAIGVAYDAAFFEYFQQ
jgi:cobyrinic acid a,c-diamide synthase